MLVIPNKTVVIRGAGDLASGIAHRLHRAGFKVLMLEVEKPLVIRRKVAFATAVLENEAVVEGVKAVKVETIEEIYEAFKAGYIPVLIDPEAKVLTSVKPGILVDAIIAKKNMGTHREMAPITIGVGPGFNAGVDVDAVIETKRGHYLGKLIFSGCAEKDTGIPGEVMGYTEERVLRSPADGNIHNLLDIGAEIKKGQIISYVGKEAVKATIDGVLRGLITDGMYVTKGLKIGDIDPRGVKEYCWTISEKARAIGGSVLEAILYLRHRLN
ncbi:selenium-dependent molybdenum cofactor biosynthesis protein YqeB [Thermosyntropha sp.]|uniref:selenium-dependent molybdenum cofactor biosynthesis protein YqeB n=1 Tax=Thermosyntropha sp. TaxID=2740820 RepID=UPI0034506722